MKIIASYFFAAFLFGGTGLSLIVPGVATYQQGKATEKWVAVEANVDSFDVVLSRVIRRSKRRGNQRHFRTVILYGYEYSGLKYAGEYNSREYKEDYIPKDHINKTKRPIHGKAEVYVDPANPSSSTYVKGVPKGTFFAMAVAIGLLLAGLRFVFLAFRGLKSL